MLSATVTLTDAQIKTLPSTPIEVLAAPGEGKAYIIFGTILYHAVWTGYTGLAAAYPTALYLFAGAGQVACLIKSAALLNGSEEKVYYAPPDLGIGTGDYDGALFGAVGTSNQSVEISMDNDTTDNLTGGNEANTLKVTVFYAIVDL